VRTERVRDDDFPEPDTVVGSDPAAGEMLAEGAEFTLVVSDGPEFRTLPEFVDRPVDDVLATLDELALEGVEAPDRVFSEDVPDGAVVSWQVEGSPSLSAGGQVLPGEVVTLTVSKGPEPRPAPDMVGLTVAEAAAAADGVQLGLSQGEEVFSDDVAAGRVVSQEPPPETPVERGGTVTVQVSKGPDVIPLPDVIDLPFDRAQRVLNRNGFRVGDVLGTTDGNVVSISVDGERADVGSTYRRGTAVDVISL
jgi:serine/threonine-protein kinase